MSEENQNNFQPGKYGSIDLIDLRRVIARFLRYWYIVALSIIVSLSTAFLINRYADRVYDVRCSILIKEGAEVSGSAEILYNNPLVNSYRNFFNELYIIRSFPLIGSIVDSLDLNITYFGEGRVKTTELYKDRPFSLKPIDRHQKIEKTVNLRLSTNSEGLNVVILGQDSLTEMSIMDRDTLRLDNGQFVLNIDQPLSDESIYLVNISPTNRITSSYVGRLNADWAEEGASVVELSLRSKTPWKDTDFLNKLVELYGLRDEDNKKEAANRSLDFINKQIDSIWDSLKIFEGQLEKFKSTNLVSDLGSEAQRVILRIEKLEDEMGLSRVQQSYYNLLNKYISEEKNLDQVFLPSSVGINDPILNELINRMIEIQLTIKSYGETSENAANPIIRKAFNDLNQLKNTIQESTKKLSGTNQIAIDEKASQIISLEKELGTMPSAERQLVTIRRNFLFSENIYNFLMQKRVEAGITAASSVSDIFLINPARASGPISPNTRLNYSIAISISIIIPFALFFLLEYFNNKIQSKEDIQNITDIPILGGVGHSGDESKMIVLTKPKGIIAESFRSVRSNLNYFTNGKENIVYLITSSISAEGKTFTSINLAIVLAFSGKKVVLVGADMRRPKMFDDFGLSNDFGLSTYLSTQSNDVSDLIQPTKVDNLSLLSGGPIPPNPGELLMSSKMQDLVTELKSNYDYVILDTPPINIVADALEITKFADHTIYITRQNYTPKESVRLIQQLYENRQIPHISILLNDIEKSGLGYGYGNGYGYGYSYNLKSGYYES